MQIQMKKSHKKIICGLLLIAIASIVAYSMYNKQYETESNFNMDLIMSQPVSRKYAVISFSRFNERSFYYVIYLPLCALAWRRIGYEPILILIEKEPLEHFSKITNKTMEYLNLFGVKIFVVNSPPDYENHISQLVRLYVGLLPASLVKENDFVLISDSDIIPVNRNYFNFFNTLSIVILNAYSGSEFEYKGKQYYMYPMSYIGMRKWQWREMMNVTRNLSLTGELVVEKASQFYGKGSVRKNYEITKGDVHWDLDQRILSVSIDDYLQAKSDIRASKFKLDSRLDRSFSYFKWYQMTSSFNQIQDCHLFHNNAEEKLPLINRLLAKMFNENICNVLSKYFADFFILMNTEVT
jgi:hypothetical protein